MDGYSGGESGRIDLASKEKNDFSNFLVDEQIMRLRLRLVTGFVAVHLVLSAAAGLVAWTWLDASQRAQAEESARAVGTVIARGGFSLSDRVIERMRTLTGYEFRVLSSTEKIRPGTVQVVEGGLVVEIDYRNAAWHRVSRQVLWGTVFLFVSGSAIFALVAAYVARQFARPIEQLVVGARAIGAGTWITPLPVVGTGEVAELARELERMRVKLVALDQAHRQAERLATLGTFTATIAHEVRNPLSAVRMTVQLLNRRLPGDPGLELIMSEIERLDLIVDELLGFSRGMTIVKEPTDLGVVVASIVRLLQRQADHAAVAMEVRDLRTTDQCTVSADPQRLRQLLLNLVLNGIQAVQRGPGSTVQITINDDSLRVDDDGPGVTPELLPRLFEPFSSSRPAGTGLGLHLAKSIADAHGCRLRHESGKIFPGAVTGAQVGSGAGFVLDGFISG